MPTPYPDKVLGPLFRSRYHGASMFKGADWQISVAIRYLLQILGGDIESIVLEGLEDIDVRSSSARAWVQAKSLADFSWGKFQKALENALPMLANEPTSEFQIVAVEPNFTGDMERLVRIQQGNLVDGGVRGHLAGRVRSLCQQHGLDPAEVLFDRTRIEVLTRDELWEEIAESCHSILECSEQAVCVYLSAFAGRLLRGSAQREQLTYDDAYQWVEQIRCAMALDRMGYRALTDGMVSEIVWERVDANAEDFFQGKAVRPGHIHAGLDVRRPSWLQSVANAQAESLVCVIRSSSGQGKSTLMMRHAYETRENFEDIQLLACMDDAGVACVREFLTNRSTLRRPIRLLVDGADYRTLRWVDVATHCVSLGFPVLVAVRQEDFERFGSRISFDMRVVSPSLQEQEAREIYALFMEQGHLHEDAPRVEDALEMVGKPSLLMEYTYLLTHGRMLRDRLAEQVRSMEDSPHVPDERLRTLRLISTAHVLGGVVLQDKLLRHLGVVEASRLLRPLRDEYIDVRSGLLKGLHWIRSEHLRTILHDEFHDEFSTFRELLTIVDDDSVHTMIVAMLMLHSDERAMRRILEACADWASAACERILRVFGALFEATVRQYAMKHQDVFQLAYEEAGASLLSLFVMQSSVLGGFLEEMPRTGYVPRLQDLSRELAPPRHFALVHEFLMLFPDSVWPVVVENLTPQAIGQMLNWAYWADARPKSLVDAISATAEHWNVRAIPIDELSYLLLGFGRFDPTRYSVWLDENLGELELVLRNNLQLTSFRLINGEVQVAFLLTPLSDLEDVNGEAVQRVEMLRRCFPLLERYCTEASSVYSGIGLFDNISRGASKHIPTSNLPVAWDVAMNVQAIDWMCAVLGPTTLYSWAQTWLVARKDVEKSIDRFTHNSLRNLQREGKRRKRRGRPSFNLQPLLRGIRKLSSSHSEELRDAEMGARQWLDELVSFQHSMLLAQDGRGSYGSALEHIRRAIQALESLDHLFNLLEDATYGFHPDLDQQQERSRYEAMERLVQAIHENPTAPLAFLRSRVNTRRQIPLEILRALGDADLNHGRVLFDEGALLGLLVLCPIQDLLDIERDVQVVADGFASVAVQAPMWLYLVPIYQGSRVWGPRGFRLLQGIDRPWHVVDIPEVAWSTLDHIPPESSPIELQEQSFFFALELLIQTKTGWQDWLERLRTSKSTPSKLIQLQESQLNQWLAEEQAQLSTALATLSMEPEVHSVCDELLSTLGDSNARSVSLTELL